MGGYHDESDVQHPVRSAVRVSTRESTIQRQRRAGEAQRAANKTIATALKKGQGRKV